MNKYLSQFFIFFLITCSTSSFARSMGTESAGGGGVFWLQGRHILMDYFTIIEGLEELPAPHYEEESGVVVRETKAFKEARRVLDTWSKFHLNLMPEMIKIAMDGNLEWNFVDEELKAPPFYLAPSVPENSQALVAAFYEKSANDKILVKLNREIWRQLDFEGQVGLIIHETLR